MEQDKKMTSTGQTGTAYSSSASVEVSQTHGESSMGSTMPSLQEVKEKAVETGAQLKEQALEKAKGAIAGQKEMATGQLDQLASAFRQTGKSLRDHEQTAVAQYADRVADQVERFSSYIRDRDMEGFKGELEGFARRKPGMFLWSAFAAGFMLVRFLKSSGSSTTMQRGGTGQRFGYHEGYGLQSSSYSTENYPSQSETFNAAADNVLPISDYDPSTLSGGGMNTGDK